MSPARNRGTVLDGAGGVWRVRSSDGSVYSARLRGRVKNESTLKLAVGDDVLLEEDARGGTWTIAEIEPRRSQLARREPGARHGERILAANVDQVVVVFAIARPEPHLRMLDRFLVIAEANGLGARIVVNKLDLGNAESVELLFAPYARAGYPLHLTSVIAGTGLDELHVAMRGRSSVYAGPSGVGKSSLLNAIYPGLKLRVGDVSDFDDKGTHTTVGALLHPLPDGGFVVDTPGLREVGMWRLPAAELAGCFPEFRPLIRTCRFSDCAHIREPGCAVRDSVAGGGGSAARYDSYVKLYQELLESEQLLEEKKRPKSRR